MFRILLTLLILLPLALTAAYLENLPTTVIQPDGTVLNLLASGDEFANRLHDANGYTIIQSNTDGYFYYAEKNGEELVPSAFRAGTINPASKSITPNLNISEAEYKEKARFMQYDPQPEIRTPQTGTVNNICILIRFSDQTEFPQPRSFYEDEFNATQDNSISQRNYFQKASYGQLDIITSVYPTCSSNLNLSYQDSNPRDYYIPYNAITNPIGYIDDNERADREFTLLANAVTAIASQVPADLVIDADGDGYVDNVCFIVRGPHTAWAELLWGHRWALYGAEASINNKMVWDFTFQMENQCDVRTLCHEMFHSIGSPDLYHYNFDGQSPVGCWDIMESGFGHMSAYMKMQYGGWLPNAAVISQTGDYTLQPVTSATNSIYKINVSGQQGEAIYLEYRKKSSDCFEQNLPDSGLLIYRINSSYYGNSDGPPDEVYIYRPNGTTTVNGDIALANFSADNYRTEFNDYTNPNCTLLNGGLAHVNISNISQSGEAISFHYSATNTNLPPQISSVFPGDGAVLPVGDYNLGAVVTVQGDAVSQVEFRMDGILISTLTSAPYSYLWQAGVTDYGFHELLITATTSGGMSSSHFSRFRIIDPMQENWFTWATDNPVYASYGRGSLPIQVAVDFDLGAEEYVVKGLAVNIEDDPYGDPVVPGMISVKINRFANGLITEQTLLNLGNFTIPYGTHHEILVDNDIVINGNVALVINLYEYQNIFFDTNGVIGHTWITEPNRPWMDALGRGMLGAADIALKLQSPNVGTDENVVLLTVTSLTCYPNPFYTSTTIDYNLPKDSAVDIAVYNIKGQKVKSIVAGEQAKGNHTVAWNGLMENGQTAGNGMYFIRLADSKGLNRFSKVVLLK
jgi:M6 family metalloprotease-like protein